MANNRGAILQAKVREGRRLTLSSIVLAGLMAAVVVTAVVVQVQTGRRLERLAGRIERLALEMRCDSTAAHRLEQQLLVELARRQGTNVRGLRLTELPPGCDALGRFHPERVRRTGRRGGPAPGRTPDPRPSPRRTSPPPGPGPSPTSTCILPPPLCLPIPSP